ncbi:MAG: hypothetical protein KatS3mg105_1074 [Gemmatales bacterium]|nr:MAG: hypothetical protein KatS3mg105_1074 [Gemmatales bacterium]
MATEPTRPAFDQRLSPWTWKNLFALCVVVMIIAGMTFVSQWVTTEESRENRGNQMEISEPARLIFPVTTLTRPIFQELYPASGHVDFLFENPQSIPVELGMKEKNCKCSKVEVLLLSSEEKRRYSEKAPAAGQVGWAASGLGNLLAGLHEQITRTSFLAETARWQELQRDGGNQVILPGNRSGVVRLSWQGRQPGPQRVKVVLWYRPQSEAAKAKFETLEALVTFVEPIMADRREIDVGELTAGTQRTASFLCFSSTRAYFDLTARDRFGHPCIQCAVTPLNGLQLPAKLGPDAAPFPVLCAYRVDVTIRERSAAGDVLPLGPFSRIIELMGDDLFEPLQVSVKGVVHGDIKLITNRDRDRIELGDFAASAGVEQTVFLQTERAQTELQLASKYPQYLEVELTKEKVAGRWKLKVAIAPNRASGRLPRDAGIVLTTVGGQARELRIPVAGHAVN